MIQLRWHRWVSLSQINQCFSAPSLTHSDEKDLLLYLASAEDSIVQKLYCYKLGNEISQRQWLDVLGVLQVQGKRLDQEYLAQTAGHFHVDDLLNRAVAEAEKRG
jgi:hypothetical protein